MKNSYLQRETNQKCQRDCVSQLHQLTGRHVKVHKLEIKENKIIYKVNMYHLTIFFYILFSQNAYIIVY
jgi:hypothetical protein